ncbi:MAG: sigma-70 family RNA polymerase sigma factor [Acidobacteria bacterium]|nr:sigma-70 family RNA polymerase sigma factor [Acidobacteriota bacterium]
MERRFQIIRGRQVVDMAQNDSASQPLPGFEEALLAHLDGLLAFALRLTGGQRELAEDLVQEVSLRAFRNYQSLRAPEQIKAWFFQILVNTHTNEWRRRTRAIPIVDVELNEALFDAAQAPSPPTPEEQLFEQLLDSEVQQALDALPVEFRTVVWLSDVEELSYQEISEIINCPMGTVASRLYRGHSLLREQLREYARQRGVVKE